MPSNVCVGLRSPSSASSGKGIEASKEFKKTTDPSLPRSYASRSESDVKIAEADFLACAAQEESASPGTIRTSGKGRCGVCVFDGVAGAGCGVDFLVDVGGSR
jgi:hypothetical protein